MRILFTNLFTQSFSENSQNLQTRPIDRLERKMRWKIDKKTLQMFVTLTAGGYFFHRKNGPTTVKKNQSSLETVVRIKFSV